MQEGAFALIDCLGWKGIWKRTKDPNSAIKKLVRAEKDAKKAVSDFQRLFKRHNVELKTDITMLSDTIAISCPYIDQGEAREIEEFFKGFSVQLVVLVAAKFLQLLIYDQPYIMLRGCIVYGEHIIENNFIVGPAVDQAAVSYEIADGAFVWLHPNTFEYYEKYTTF
jgi:hypothetical protein